MTYLGRFNKLLRQIRQLETNDYYSNAQILDQFIAELKDKLIKKVYLHVPADLATAIRHAKNYEMAIEKANYTKLINLAIGETTTSQTNNNSNNNYKDINPHNDTTKTILDHHPTTNIKIVIIVEFQDTKNEIVGNYKETNKTGVINATLYHNNFITNFHHQPIIHQDHKIKTVIINQLYNQCSNNISNLYQFSHIRHHPLNNIKYQQENWFNITNLHPKINFRITTTKSIQITSCYLTIPEESDFQQPALSEGKVAAPRSNLFNNTIPPAQIAQNANLSDIFPFEFEANKSLFLFSNVTANEQRALVGKDWLLKTNANLNWETQKLKISYQGQYTIIPVTSPVFEFEEEKKIPLTETYMALGSTSNWAEETEQKIFEESREWKKVRYSTSEPWKQPPYIPLKCKDCNKKLSSMRACISPEEEYETQMLPEKCNWIDVAMRGGVCDQTCQYALSISEKVRRGTPFDAAYNSTLNKLYHYSHDAKMIFDLAMALINGAT
ncbi:hypothetical protein G9A89_008350 [Geosiphon pyriformis]|nr:hypothetical protein G9A89_008350 [Geosiphon pyriformis]